LSQLSSAKSMATGGILLLRSPLVSPNQWKPAGSCNWRSRRKNDKLFNL